MSTGSSTSCLEAYGGSHSEFSRTQNPWQDFHWTEEVEHNKQHRLLCYFSVNKFKFQLLNFQISFQEPANQTFPHQVSHQWYQHFPAHFLFSTPKLSLENVSLTSSPKPRYSALPNQAWLPLKSPSSVAFLKSMRKRAQFPQEKHLGVRVHREFILPSALFLSAIRAWVVFTGLWHVWQFGVL